MPVSHNRPSNFRRFVFLPLLLCGSAISGWAASPNPIAHARAVYTEVNQIEPLMAVQRFRARLAGAEYASEVVAKTHKGQIRKVAVTDLDDSGNVLTDLYYSAEGSLVFALRTIQGYKANGRLETRNENRLYFQEGRAVEMLAGLEKANIALSDPLAQSESATTLATSRAVLAATAAPPAPTVLVGNQRKIEQGTLVSIEPGDAACYLELTDTAGRLYREMADFALCETPETLMGKTVALAYKPATVMAASCQGNPSCTQSETVALVIRMAALPSESGGLAKPSGSVPTWCAQGETVVFNCQPGKKRVSVCTSNGATATRGRLVYRFGPASGGTPDLVLPAIAIAPASSATGEATGFAGGGGAWLRFTQGSHAYVVYSGVGNWGRNGRTEERNGVLVEQNGAVLANLPCISPDVNELGPDWFGAMGIKSDAKGFVFPDTGN